VSADDGASHALLVETPEAECADGGAEAAAAELGSRPDRLEEPDSLPSVTRRKHSNGRSSISVDRRASAAR
jgi:hypothetical protein